MLAGQRGPAKQGQRRAVPCPSAGQRVQVGAGDEQLVALATSRQATRPDPTPHGLRVALQQGRDRPDVQLVLGPHDLRVVVVVVVVLVRAAVRACPRAPPALQKRAPRQQGFAIFGAEGQYNEAACRAGNGSQQAPIALGTKGDTLTFSSYFDGWGYVHLYRNSGGKMAELDTYAIDEAHDQAFATGFGDLSVHEVATSQVNPKRAYLSYYSGGLRVVDIQGTSLKEVGRFIDQGGSNHWGVETFQHAGQEYVAASDPDSGLYIFKVDG